MYNVSGLWHVPTSPISSIILLQTNNKAANKQIKWIVIESWWHGQIAYIWCKLCCMELHNADGISYEDKLVISSQIRVIWYFLQFIQTSPKQNSIIKILATIFFVILPWLWLWGRPLHDVEQSRTTGKILKWNKHVLNSSSICCACIVCRYSCMISKATLWIRFYYIQFASLQVNTGILINPFMDVCMHAQYFCDYV